MYNKMEEKHFSSESENETEKELINIKDFGKVLREKITKCLNEESHQPISPNQSWKEVYLQNASKYWDSAEWTVFS